MSEEWRELPDGRQRLRADGVIEMRHRDGAVQTGDSVRRQLEHVEELLAGRGPAPMLVVLGLVKRQTFEARELLIKSETTKKLVSRVALVQRTPVSRVMTAFFLQLVRSPIPIRVFDSEEKALSWLKEH